MTKYTKMSEERDLLSCVGTKVPVLLDGHTENGFHNLAVACYGVLVAKIYYCIPQVTY